jgi:NAD(P)-dependent dehydrogenase (short-subunit alcohol dehydrogenase family)
VAQRGSPAYVATKGAAVQLARALALDWAPDGIRVNAVCPGLVDTRMLRSVLWLASTASSFVTGVALAVDGGFTAQ